MARAEGRVKEWWGFDGDWSYSQSRVGGPCVAGRYRRSGAVVLAMTDVRGAREKRVADA
jgi:hypothetical protein